MFKKTFKEQHYSSCWLSVIWFAMLKISPLRIYAISTSMQLEQLVGEAVQNIRDDY